jgi:hypothetical protein
VPAPDPTDHPRPPPPRERSALPGPARTLHTVATCSPTNSSSGSRRCSPTTATSRSKRPGGIYQRMITAYRQTESKPAS